MTPCSEADRTKGYAAGHPAAADATEISEVAEDGELGKMEEQSGVFLFVFVLKK